MNTVIGLILELEEYFNWMNTVIGWLLQLDDYCNWLNTVSGWIQELEEYCNWRNALIDEYCNFVNSVIGCRNKINNFFIYSNKIHLLYYEMELNPGFHLILPHGWPFTSALLVTCFLGGILVFWEGHFQISGSIPVQFLWPFKQCVIGSVIGAIQGHPWVECSWTALA